MKFARKKTVDDSLPSSHINKSKKQGKWQPMILKFNEVISTEIKIKLEKLREEEVNAQISSKR